MNGSPNCAFEHDDGAYVLGALSAADRLAFEHHLATCANCTQRVRELAGMPGLLGRIDSGALTRGESLPPVPATLMPALAFAVRREERRRTTWTALVAAAVAAVVVGMGAMAVHTVGDQTTPTSTPVSTAMSAVDTAMAVQANLSLEDVAWGTRIGLVCAYREGVADHVKPPHDTFLLIVRTRDGRTEQVGTWRSVDGQEMRLQAATATRQDDIAAVEVQTTDGQVVLASTV